MHPQSPSQLPKGSSDQEIDIVLTDEEMAKLAELAAQCGMTVEQAALQLTREALARRVRRRIPRAGGR